MRFLRSLATLLFLVAAGCAGPERAVLPPHDDYPDRVAAGHRVVRTGDRVRIETKSRDVVLGEVTEVAQDHVVLGRVGNYGYVERSIRADEILAIELNGGDSVGTEAKNVGIILGVTIAAFALAFVFFGGSIGGN